MLRTRVRSALSFCLMVAVLLPGAYTIVYAGSVVIKAQGPLPEPPPPSMPSGHMPDHDPQPEPAPEGPAQ